MRLTETAIREINKPAVRVRLAAALNFTEQWIIRLLDKNGENGPLTTMAAIQVIKENTKLHEDQILETAPVS